MKIFSELAVNLLSIALQYFFSLDFLFLMNLLFCQCKSIVGVSPCYLHKD